MRKIPRILSTILLSINLIAILILIISAYSSYLDPEMFPILSNMGLGYPIILLINLSYIVFWIILKKKYIQYSLIGILITCPQLFIYAPFNLQNKDISSEKIKVISYNVMSFNALRKEKNGTNTILEYLKKSNADILCLQEYNVSSNPKYVTQKDVNKALKDYPYKSINSIGGKNSGNRLAIYSKYPINKVDPIAYKSSYNGSVAYNLKIGKKDYLLINNHFESNKITREDKVVYERIINMSKKDQIVSDTKGLISKFVEASSIRQKQAKTVANYIKNSKLPYIIICGDFNDSPLSYTNKLLEENLDNAFVKSGKGLGISYNQNKFYFRIDNILTSKNLKAHNCVVDKSIKASDHYPIFCYITKR